MRFPKGLKALVVTLALLVVFSGAFTIMSASSADAARCCWVRVCTVNPPMICWDICVPCPPLFP
jgi:hypothetical protein